MPIENLKIAGLADRFSQEQLTKLGELVGMAPAVTDEDLLTQAQSIIETHLSKASEENFEQQRATAKDFVNRITSQAVMDKLSQFIVDTQSVQPERVPVK